MGFYCTKDLELAKEWSVGMDNNGYANKYELDITNLKILNLNDEKYNVLNWLAILVDNRKIKSTSPTFKNACNYLLNNYLIDYYDYDIITGYRADDSYFAFARAFLLNIISIQQLEHAIKLGNLGNQLVFKYIDSEFADKKIYLPKREERENKARNEYQRLLEIEDRNGIFIRDLMYKGIKLS